MNRFSQFIATGVLVMLWAGPVLAAQVKSQPTQPQGQPMKPQGQPMAPQGGTYGGITQNPWFGDKAVQQQLRLSNNQYTGLNKGYAEAWNNYNTNVGQLGKTLTEQQRAEKMLDLQATFNQRVGQSVDTFVSEPQQRQRYNQLNVQYQNYGAFNNPTLQQQLNLTNEQRQQIAQYGQEWNKQMGLHHQSYQADPQGTTDRYNALNKQTNERYNSVLNDQQRLIWRQVNGESYNFPPSVYFQK